MRQLAADLVLVGVQAHDELDGVLAPALAAALELPYVGVIRGVNAQPRPRACWPARSFPAP